MVPSRNTTNIIALLQCIKIVSSNLSQVPTLHYTLPPTSHLGEALQPDGTLKDVSEINWTFDANKTLPFPQASGDPSGGPSTALAPAEAGLHQMTCTICPAHRYIEGDLECVSSINAQPVAKCKALSDNMDPNWHVSCKVIISLDSDSNKDVPSVPPTEDDEDDYESLQVMADANNLVCLPSPSLSFSSHLHHRLQFPDLEQIVQPMCALSSTMTNNAYTPQQGKPWMAIGVRSASKHICFLSTFLFFADCNQIHWRDNPSVKHTAFFTGDISTLQMHITR